MAKILIAEDDEAVRSLVLRALGEDGHDLTATADGAAALAALVRHNGDFDLLLTDVKMPTMDGIALALAAGRERQRDAVHDRHLHVGQQQIEFADFAVKRIERRRAVGGFDQLVTILIERTHDEVADGGVVLGDQDSSHYFAPAMASCAVKKRTITSLASAGGAGVWLRNSSRSPGPRMLRGGGMVQV